MTLHASARDWWRKRRLVYNAGLVLAGMSSLTLLAGVLEFSRCRAPDLEGAPLKLVYLALGYGAAMGLANLVYSLGQLGESRLQPARVPAFRRWAFGLGFAVSFALPFAPCSFSSLDVVLTWDSELARG